jgi:hypothetical protein
VPPPYPKEHRFSKSQLHSAESELQMDMSGSTVLIVASLIPMPWTCPACSTQIRPAVAHHGDLPRTDVVYRCPVCRLELVFNSTSNTLMPAPLPDPGKTAA